MNQARAVDRVFAVVAGIMVSTGNINRSLVHVREELRRRIDQSRGDLNGIVRVQVGGIPGNGRPGKWIAGNGARNCRGRRVAHIVGEARVRHGGIGAAALMV